MGGNHSINASAAGGDWIRFQNRDGAESWSLTVEDIFKAEVRPEGGKWVATINGEIAGTLESALRGLNFVDWQIAVRLEKRRGDIERILRRHQEAAAEIGVAPAGEGCMSFTLRDGTVVRPGDTVGVMVGGVPDYGPVPIRNKKG